MYTYLYEFSLSGIIFYSPHPSDFQQKSNGFPSFNPFHTFHTFHTFNSNRVTMSQTSLMDEIKASLATHARSATFACGGSIPIKQTPTKVTTETVSSSLPVQVRYGSNGSGSTLNIPGSEPSSSEFKELLNVSLPATFARAGEEVLDEDYRKAGKLDRGQFATDFCPHEVGIVDTLTQMLLPQTKHSKHVRSIKVWWSFLLFLPFH
jgi:hypothetical protein